ncbi:hypothetical protein N7510_008304 [Penicillium lagena]|uniref:uncharacterized protein n=1 Tax=Penicillium lagena TaxID=94218 RepID=UPI002540D20D|nr:uncharacterized protein N7510_008304 [Penicillium lagena]KAJ5605523.1 hypothetical protein N7510_008304 [Penicillium lagena]
MLPPHTAWISGLLLTFASLAHCGTLTFTDPNGDGQCYVQLDGLLECTGITSDSIGEINWEGYCSKFDMMPDNSPTSKVQVCDKHLYVTWSKDLWGNHIAHFQLGEPYEDERLDLIGVMNYETGLPNNVAATTPLPSW